MHIRFPLFSRIAQPSVFSVRDLKNEPPYKENFAVSLTGLVETVFPFVVIDCMNETHIYEGLPGVLGNKGTLAKYRREQRNISQFLGTREQNSKNNSTKMCGKYENVWEMCVRKCVGTWEHRAILEGNKGTWTPPGRPSYIRNPAYFL